MAVTLFTSPIENVGWDDVLEFCKLGMPEGITVDYKREIPGEISRTIAAMANTNGGLILIGVDEARESTKPIVPPCCIALERGLREKITNLCVANLSPPLIPEIALVCHPSESKAVIVLRIPQSYQAPHATAKNTRVYLRRGGTNSPEDLATLDELEWLKSGRKRSVEFREALHSRAEQRFNQFLKGLVASSESVPRVATDGLLSLTFCPTYPKLMLRQPPELKHVLRNIRVNDYYGSDHQFPLGSLNGVVVQDGYIVHASIDHGKWVYHTELNSYGMFFFKQSLIHDVDLGGNNSHRLMRASELFARLDQMFDCSDKYFRELGFFGAVNFRMRLENLVGFPMGRYSTQQPHIDLAYTPDPVVEFNATLNAANIEKEKSEIILSATQLFGWAFDWQVSAALLNAYYMKHKGQEVIKSDEEKSRSTSGFHHG